MIVNQLQTLLLRELMPYVPSTAIEVNYHETPHMIACDKCQLWLVESDLLDGEACPVCKGIL